MADLLQLFADSGAEIDPATGRPLSFGDRERELRSALDGTVLVDRSDLTRLSATGPDFLPLLQRLSTGDVLSLVPGEGRSTVLTSAKGRIVELLVVHRLTSGGVLTLAGPRRTPAVLDHLRRYALRENLGLVDLQEQTRQFALIGPHSGRPLEALGLARPGPYRSASVEIGGGTADLLGHDGLSKDGLSFVVPRERAKECWAALHRAVQDVGGCAAGDVAVEAWRVLLGLPAAGRELTEERNPLEAGLWEAVSFEKGCYVGQEVVARLRTYDKVARTLVGLELAPGVAAPPRGARLLHGGRSVGELTSSILPPGFGAVVALGYVKRAVLEEGLRVTIGEEGGPSARVVKLPFHC